MKNTLRNILLSIPLALSLSCATLDKKAVDLSYIQNVGMLVQNSALIYEDIFTYTKVGVEQFGALEANPIANIFVNNNQWNYLYFSSVGATILGNYLSYKVDKSGTLAKIINGTIAIAETNALSMWINLNYPNKYLDKKWKDKFKDTKITVEIFRINY